MHRPNNKEIGMMPPMNSNNPAPLLRGLILIATVGALTACGGGGGGGGSGSSGVQANLVTDQDPENLGANEVIEIRFDRSMDTSSLVLGGDLSEEEHSTEWSRSADGQPNNNTLEITPTGYWPIETGQTLTVRADAASGGESASLDEEFRVILKFGEATESFTETITTVIGQDDRDSGGGTGKFDNPVGSGAFALGRLYLPNTGMNEILVFDGVPEDSGANEIDVLDQPGFLAPQSATAAADEDGAMFAVADTGNHRVLIYDEAPASDIAPSAIIEGSACEANGFNAPESVFIASDGKMFVADTGNHRVLMWNSVPTADGESADAVLGQADFGGGNCEPNRNGGPAANTLNEPVGVWADQAGSRVVIADRGNRRVLVWESYGLGNGQAASFALGQGDLQSDDVRTQDNSNLRRMIVRPTPGVASNGHQLFVSAEDPGTTLVWNRFPTEMDEAATGVLAFVGSDGEVDSTEYQPNGLLLVDDNLIAGDPGNNRYLIFQSQ